MASNNKEQITEDEVIPIRDLSSITGVNSVTIRAWERRYGLLKPRRTPKGHRLYTQEHVDIINEIKRHLNRGIAISKVKDLLHSETHSFKPDDEWQQHSDQIIEALNNLNEHKLDAILHELTGSYPALTIWQHLIKPLTEQYSHPDASFGSHSKILLWHKVLSEQVARQVKKFAQGSEKIIVLSHLEPHSLYVEPLFIALQLVEAGFKPDLTYTDLTLEEIPFVIEQVKANGLLLFGNNTITKQIVNREIAGRLGKLNIPVMVAGNTAAVSKDFLDEFDVNNSASHETIIDFFKSIKS